MDSEARSNVIIDFVADHQGCTAQVIVDGVKDQMSRTLVFSTLKSLVNDHVIVDEKLNRRDHRYFVNSNSLLHLVTRELNEFEERILRWIKSVKVLYDRQFALAKKTNQPVEYKRAFDIDSFAWLTSKTIIADVVNTYTGVALTKWPKQSKDGQFLDKLYVTLFSKFQRILSRVLRMIPFGATSERPETVENIRQFRNVHRDFVAFRDCLYMIKRDNRLDNTEFEDMMKMVWKMGHDEDKDEQSNWREAVEEDGYR